MYTLALVVQKYAKNMEPKFIRTGLMDGKIGYENPIKKRPPSLIMLLYFSKHHWVYPNIINDIFSFYYLFSLNEWTFCVTSDQPILFSQDLEKKMSIEMRWEQRRRQNKLNIIKITLVEFHFILFVRYLLNLFVAFFHKINLS